MFKSFLTWLAIMIVVLPGCTGTESVLAVDSLQCENLNEPLGIGTDIPRLSWKIRSRENGTLQKAYQILAAGNEDLLNEEKADLWNSGRRESAESVLVPWQGKALTSRSVCYWKIRIWDENNRMSEWSDVAFFSIGLLDHSDWKAKYIGFPIDSGYTISPQLRRTFNLQETGDNFFLHVNSLGYHEVYVNGNKAGKNVLTPAVSQFNKRSLVITYDLTSLVRKGMNDLVIWIAQGWYSKGLPGVVDGGPFVKAQAEMLKEGRWETIICTDSTWTGRNSGYSTIGTWRPHKFGGEQVDASLLLPDLSSLSLDKTRWDPVITTNIPTGEASPQLTPSNRIFETLTAVSVKAISDSTWLVDMGKTLTGYARIRFPGLRQGQKIIMEYCDHLDTNGNAVNQDQQDRYIAAGSKGELFCNKFNYHGFRYIKISGVAKEPDIKDINADLIHTGYKAASSFECSDPELNKIHDMINYTLRCLSLGGDLVDCPQIERLGYGGDGNASTETAQIMFDLAPLYANWLQAWVDCIRDDGGMPHTAPNPYRAGGGPYWCGFIITASWRTYQNYGDIGFLGKYYPVMQKWLEYADKYSPEGLLRRWPDTDYRNWYLGDWATPEGVDQTDPRSVDLVNNCFMIICYEAMQKIAGILGKTSDAEQYRLKKVHNRELVHREFYDANKKSYASGSQIDRTYPLLAGVVPDSLTGEVKATLYDNIENKNKGHLATGLVGIPVFTEWAVLSRETGLMYSMLKKRDYPGYLYMLENGATTTWEHWDGRRSRIHNCYNGIGSWFYQALGGIKPDYDFPGYKHMIIDPQIPEGITRAETSKETPYGTVIVNWEIVNRIFSMKVSVPVGSTAHVVIPETVQNYKMNGESFKNELLYADIESGNYSFGWNR